MQRLIKHGELVESEWKVADDSFSTDTAGNGKWIVPLDTFISLAENQADLSKLGVSLNSDDDINLLEPYLADLRVIALKFDVFADGRSFSQARMLRDHFDFTGEIRAIGDFIQDQLFYLSRCGVDAFVLPEDSNTESAINSLGEFTERYQAACDEPQPLFRRRV